MKATFVPARLRRARGGHSVERIASVVGKSHQTIRNWEAGAGQPNADELRAISEFTGKPLDFFFRKTA